MPLSETIVTKTKMVILSSPHPLPTQFSASSASLLVRRRPITACQVCTHNEALNRVDKSTLNVAEGFAEDELWAAACLRVRSFYQFKPTMFGLQVCPSNHLTKLHLCN